MQERHAFAEFVPLSATQGRPTCSACSASSSPTCPSSPGSTTKTRSPTAATASSPARSIREKLFRLTGDELPYTSTVVIDKFEEEGELRRIAATIVVERDAHKGMIIGGGGERLKRIGSEARQELERLLDAQGLPRAVGQGALGLGRRRSAPALATATNSRRPAAPPASRWRAAPARQPSLAAYVLHRYDWSESSLILDLFTREQGRDRRRRQGRQAAVLAAAQRAAAVPAPAGLARPRSRARRRRAARCRPCAAPNGPAARPMLTGAALFSGFYLNELLMKLLARHDPHAALFDAYAGTLAALAQARRRAARRPRCAPSSSCCCARSACCPTWALETVTQRAGAAPTGATSCSPMPASSRPHDENDATVSGATLLGLRGGARTADLAALQQVAAGALAELKPAAARACFTIISALRSCARAR